VRRKGPNPVRHSFDGTSVITVIRKGVEYEIFLDTADYDVVKGYRWKLSSKRPHKNRTFYAQAQHGDTTVGMHSLLLPDAAQVDHRDGNGLNNRRNNLRPATGTEQEGNKKKRTDKQFASRFRGVTWHSRAHKFQAQMKANGKHLYLGCFISEIEAALAYDAAALKYFGEFANLNFPAKPSLISGTPTVKSEVA
jgi:hypothetical protein